MNCYKTDDWMLGLMWRSKAWQVGVAGLGPVLLQGGSGQVDTAQELKQKEEEEDEDEENGSTWRQSSPEDNSGSGGEQDRDKKEKGGLVLSLLAHDPAWRTGVENIDISDLVPSHLQYAERLKQVLQRVGLS